MHSESCGHIAIQHGNHVGFLVDGELECFDTPLGIDLTSLTFHENHRSPGGRCASLGKMDGCDENPHVHALDRDGKEILLLPAAQRCSIPVTKAFPADCNGGLRHRKIDPSRHCDHHDKCGHVKIKHGDHYDYLMPSDDGRLELIHSHVCTDGKVHYDSHGVIGPTSALLDETKDATKNRPYLEVTWRYRVDVGRDKIDSWLKPSSAADHSEINIMPLSPKALTTREKEFVKGEIIRTNLFVEGICCPSEVHGIEKS